MKPSSIKLLHVSWLVVVGLLVLLIAILSLTKVDMIARADGRMLHTARVQHVHSTSSGKLLKLAVAEGQAVKRGQALVELDPDPIETEMQRLRLKLYDAKVRYASYANGPPVKVDPKLDPDGTLRRIIQDRMVAENEYQFSRLSVARKEPQLADAQLNVERANLRRAESALPLTQERHRIAETLVESGFQAPTSTLQLRQTLLESEKLLAVSVARVIEQEQLLEQKRLSLKTMEAEYRRYIAEKVQTAYSEVAATEADLARVMEALKLVTVVAPIAGTVEEFSNDLRSNYVKSGVPLMIIVPEVDPVEAEVLVANQDHPYLRIGQSARLKVEAFPYTIYGTIPGTVIGISREPFREKGSGAGGFRVKIRPNVFMIEVDGRKVLLQSGMLVQADVQLGTRRPIDILLSPFRSFATDAFADLN